METPPVFLAMRLRDREETLTRLTELCENEEEYNRSSDVIRFVLPC